MNTSPLVAKLPLALLAIVPLTTLVAAGQGPAGQTTVNPPAANQPAPTQGVGDLLIAPTRVVFEGAKRTAEINLLNIGSKPATYRISFIHQKMDEDGKLQPIETPSSDDKFADDLVRFTPRQVVLEPHVSQLIRLQVRIPAGLVSGEYRSHLLFRAVPVGEAPPETTTTEPPKGVSIKITPIYGVSIPVIVRQGTAPAKASISDVHLVTTPDGTRGILGRITRSGNESVYGDLKIAFIAKQGALRTIGLASGIAVYTPNASRNFALRLNIPEGVKLENGTIHVIYQQSTVDGGAILADTSVDLP